MKKNEICELETTKIDKLLTNFSNEYFDQFKSIQEGDKIKFTISLVYVDEKQYFYKLTVADKLAKVKQQKEVAGKFFKQGNYKKASKLY